MTSHSTPRVVADRSRVVEDRGLRAACDCSIARVLLRLLAKCVFAVSGHGRPRATRHIHSRAARFSCIGSQLEPIRLLWFRGRCTRALLDGHYAHIPELQLQLENPVASRLPRSHEQVRVRRHDSLLYRLSRRRSKTGKARGRVARNSCGRSRRGLSAEHRKVFGSEILRSVCQCRGALVSPGIHLDSMNKGFTPTALQRVRLA